MAERMVAAACRVFCVIIVSFLAGCATQSPSTPGGLDPQRLLNAIVIDDADYVRAVVSSGAAHVNQRIPAPVYMEGTPLITIAARAGSVNVLRYLIAGGADVNALTPAGETPLMLAAFFSEDSRGSGRHDAALRMLIAAGADLENGPYRYTPLSYASYKGHDQIVRYLLERGARVNADAEGGLSYINTPLMMAAMMGHLETAVMLLRAGADPRVRVKGGLTARELAVKYQHVNLARALACAETVGPGEAFASRCR